MRIAVLGFGNLVNNVHSETYNKTLEARKPNVEVVMPQGTQIKADSPFVPAKNLKLPIRLSRISSMGTPERRITMAICQGASDENVFFAESKCTDLNKAIKNLREREGIPESNAQAIGYVNLANGNSRSRMESVAQRIREWALQNGYDAVIWSDLDKKGIEFGPNSTGREILPLLENDPLLLSNTKKYIRDLPNAPNPLQRRILEMPEQENPVPPVPSVASQNQRSSSSQSSQVANAAERRSPNGELKPFWEADTNRNICRIKRDDQNTLIKNIYTQGELLGAGEAGEVYEFKTNNNKKVKAIKISNWDLEREFKLTQYPKGLPGLMKPAKAHLKIGDKYFLVMHRYDSDLESKLHTLTLEQKIKAIRQIMKGVVYLNSNKIYHGDLKAGNVLIDEKNERYDIVDFSRAGKLPNNASTREIKESERDELYFFLPLFISIILGENFRPYDIRGWQPSASDYCEWDKLMRMGFSEDETRGLHNLLSDIEIGRIKSVKAVQTKFNQIMASR